MVELHMLVPARRCREHGAGNTAVGGYARQSSEVQNHSIFDLAVFEPIKDVADVFQPRLRCSGPQVFWASGVLAAGVLAAALGRCRKGGHAAVRFSTTSKIGVKLPFSSPNARRSHDAHRVQVGVTYTERFGLCEEVAGTRRNNRRAPYQQRFCEFAYGCSLHCYLEHGKSPRLVLKINQQGWSVEFPGADISSSLQS
ncbi:hypothetical protein [Azospirillum ramasamyi]|uniref:hypothetical protein n=1 Tax=Azospirillum ramasamyi TaxID=682998 RepID=UPI0013A6EC4C|nr:hypothetical protein [Azospirillum ramasamyi]